MSVINVASECALNGFEISLVAIRGKLNTISEASGHVLHKGVSVAAIAATYEI